MPTERVETAARALKEKLDGIEGELIQVKAQSSQDTLNFPVKLNTKLSRIGETVGTGDAAPTSQMGTLYDEIAGQIDQQSLVRQFDPSAVRRPVLV